MRLYSLSEKTGKGVPVELTCPFCGAVGQVVLELDGYVGLQLVEGSCSCGAGCAVDSPEFPKEYAWPDWLDGPPLKLHKEVIRVDRVKLGVYWAR